MSVSITRKVAENKQGIAEIMVSVHMSINRPFVYQNTDFDGIRFSVDYARDVHVRAEGSEMFDYAARVISGEAERYFALVSHSNTALIFEENGEDDYIRADCAGGIKIEGDEARSISAAATAFATALAEHIIKDAEKRL